MAETIVIRLFSVKIGDLGIADEAVPFFGIGAACDTAAERLEAYSAGKGRLDETKPSHVQAVGGDGTILAEYKLTPKGVVRVAKPTTEGGRT